jgi:hypothetical protein
MKKQTAKRNQALHTKPKCKTQLYSLVLSFVLVLNVASAVAVTAPANTESPSSVTSLDELLSAIDTTESGGTIIIDSTINIYETMVIGDYDKVVTLLRSDLLTSEPMFVVLPFSNNNMLIFQNLIFNKPTSTDFVLSLPSVVLGLEVVDGY